LTFFDEFGTLVLDTAVPATIKCPTANCCPEVRSAKITDSRAKEYACCFKALADPMRIRILNLLANNDEAVCVCEIVKHFPIQQSSISHHLKILRDSRFVLAERRGTFMYYRVNRKCLAEFPRTARVILNV
jgi:ArsR family transcriptional regulator, arsenate/arsenite/antimonite-responsive transcriptional repressor